MFDRLVPLQPYSDAESISNLSSWSRAMFGGLCVLSMCLAAKSIARYQGYLSSGQAAAESPTMFLLSWIGGCDILAAAAMLALLWPSSIAGTIEPKYLPSIQRAIVSAQIGYFMLLIMLSVHILSVAGRISRGLDMVASGYYGPVSAALAFILAHPLVGALGIYHQLVFSLLPLCTLVALTAAAWSMSTSPIPTSSTLQMWVDELVTIKVTFNPSDYVHFSRSALGLFVLFHAPWVIWGHASTPGLPITLLATAGICARGIVPHILCRQSPAANMVVIEPAESEHAHQE
ncbi:hypothetical protein IWW55_004982 [Coemansia sp. RSA 2706]|nr:hypothetical protein IWW55_004982 [Coemansia sp. RSA 2706]